DRKSTRLNSSHVKKSYAVFRLTKNASRRPPSPASHSRATATSRENAAVDGSGREPIPSAPGRSRCAPPHFFDRCVRKAERLRDARVSVLALLHVDAQRQRPVAAARLAPALPREGQCVGQRRVRERERRGPRLVFRHVGHPLKLHSFPTRRSSD